NRVLLGHEPAVRVEQDARLLPILRDLWNRRREDALDVVFARAVGALLAKRTVVADADDVPAQIGERHLRRAQRALLVAQHLCRAELNRRTEARDPDVEAVGEPVHISNVREALLAPVRAPTVLDPEASLVEADDRECVAAGARLVILDDAVGPD